MATTEIIRTDDLDMDDITCICPRCHGESKLVHMSPEARCLTCGHQDTEERFLLGGNA